MQEDRVLLQTGAPALGPDGLSSKLLPLLTARPGMSEGTILSLGLLIRKVENLRPLSYAAV